MNSSQVGVSVRSRRAMLSAAALCAACGLAQAQPASWNAATTGFWNTAGNWNPAVVPDGATFTVTIDATGGLYDVNLDINPTLGSLKLDSADATLQLSGNSINIVGGYEQNNGLLRGNGLGGLTVGGNTRFSGTSSDRDVLSAGSLIFNGDVLFDCADDVDICDTDVDYNGSSMTWQGNGDLGGGMGSTYTISGATTFTMLGNDRFRHNGIGAQPTLVNNGTIRKTTGTGITEFLDVPMTNAGTLEVASGTIKSNGVTTAGNTLSGGTWNVFNGSTLDLVGNTITTNAATIHLRDSGSSFAAVNGLTTNAAAGTFQISNGRDFTTAAGFTNNGTLNVGPATIFTGSSTLAQGSSTITGGGTVKVMGAATFSGPTTAPEINAGTTVETNAALLITGASGLRLDTGGKISHKGTTGTWSGGDISMGDASDLTIQAGGLLEATTNQNVTWDNTGTRPTLSVGGTFTKKTGSGLTFLSGVTFANTGTVRVESGTLRSDQAPVAGNTLSTGKWVVQNSTLDFVAATIVTNNADVTLDGTAASFSALENNIQTNGATGILKLVGDKDLTTTGSFTNTGRLVLDPGSVFEVNSSSALTNFDSGTQTFSGGEIIITSTTSTPGVFRWLDPTFKIKNLAAKISMSGLGSLLDNGIRANESALNELDTIKDVGAFEIHDGREFKPEGDIEVQETGPNHGKLVVGVTSLFEIQDTFTLINYNTGTGEISNGDFDIKGTLSFPGAEIRRVNSTVVLDGVGSIINKTTGLEGLSSLEFLTSRGDFTIRNGKDLDVFPAPLLGPPNTLQVDGRLAVGEGLVGDQSIMTVHGDFIQNAGSTVEVLQDGILNVLGFGSGTGNYTCATGSQLRMDGGILQVQDTFFLNGSLIGDGVVAGQTVVNGSFSPGDNVGKMTFLGPLVMTTTSGLTLDITDYGAGVGFDKVVVGGPMIINPGATLTIVASEAPGFAFAYGQLFRVIDANGIIGQFAPENVFGTELDGGLYFRLDWDDPTALRLVVVPAPGAGVMMTMGVVVMGRRRRA